MSIAVPSLWLPHISSPFKKRASFSPKDIAGLTAWFDASQITGVADGATLATWPDSSGNGNNATQTTGGDQPTYYNTTAAKLVNGLPAVWWATSTDYMTTAAFATALTVGTVFAVASIDNGGANTYVYDGITGGNRWALGYGFPGLGVAQGGGTVIQTSFTQGTTVHQYTAGYAASSSSFFNLDGASVGTGNIGTDTLTGITLGAYFGLMDYNYNGVMCEFLWYNSVLSSTNINKVQAYLKSKWGTP